MLDTVRMRLTQIADSVKSNGWKSVIKEVVFLRRKAVFVEKDLSEVVERPEPLAGSKLKLLEFDKDMLTSGTFHFAVANRRLKAMHYLKEGLGGFALVQDNVVVGDFWYFASKATDDPSVLHPDLRRFGFKSWVKSEVYTFDIFVAPAERKNGVSAAFQNNALLPLRAKGFTKAYGFYMADNIPAMWCTRVTNKWKELRSASVSRFFIFMKVVPLQKARADSKG